MKTGIISLDNINVLMYFHTIKNALPCRFLPLKKYADSCICYRYGNNSLHQESDIRVS